MRTESLGDSGHCNSDQPQGLDNRLIAWNGVSAPFCNFILRKLDIYPHTWRFLFSAHVIIYRCAEPYEVKSHNPVMSIFFKTASCEYVKWCFIFQHLIGP